MLQRLGAMFRKLICPIDFSTTSQHAMRVAIRLANEADAELELLHAWHLPAFAMSIEASYPADAIEAMIAEDDKELAAAVAEAKQLGARRLTSRFAQGAAAEQICTVSGADPSCDLIVMGSHGRTGFRRVLLGSVAEKVVRHAPCSVLVVRGRDGLAPFRHVLCPIDFSPSSRDAMYLAAELAARDGMGVTLLHVLEVLPASGGETALDMFSNLDRAAAQLLEEWAQELRAKVHVPVEKRSRIGSPAAQVLTVLDHELSYDLVVVGSHGRTGLSRVVLGSVAERIVRHAPCPVLVTRARV